MEPAFDLPTSPKSCLSTLEANLFVTEGAHFFLRRCPSSIRIHVSTCGACQLTVSHAWRKLREDHNRVRRLLGRPELPAVIELLPPVCFESNNPFELRNAERNDAEVLADNTASPEDDVEGDSSPKYAQNSDADLITFLETGQDIGRANCEPIHDTRRKLQYGERQLRHEVSAKEAVASWVAKDIPIADEASIFVDAGSQCYFAWKALLARLKDADISDLNLLTFNWKVAADWFGNVQEAQAVAPHLVLGGDRCNASHLSLMGSELDRLKSFHPSVVLIGTNAINVEAGSINLGFNCGDKELEDKRLLFGIGALRRVILLTASKIGDPGGRALNLLDLPGLNPSAPLIFVTNAPTLSGHRDALERAFQDLGSESMRKKLVEKGISISWIVVNERGEPVQQHSFPQQSGYLV